MSLKLKSNQWWYIIGAIVLIVAVLYYTGAFSKEATATKSDAGKGKVVPISGAQPQESTQQ